MRISAKLSVVPLAAVAAVTAVVLLPSVAHAESCQDARKIVVDGAWAEYTECTRSDIHVIRVHGKVVDTLADGKCAQVYVKYNGSSIIDYSNRACPQGQTEYFNFDPREGDEAWVYLTNNPA